MPDVGGTFYLYGDFHVGTNSTFVPIDSISGQLFLRNGQTTTITPPSGVLTISHGGLLEPDSSSRVAVNGYVSNYGSLIANGAVNIAGALINNQQGDVTLNQSISIGGLINNGYVSIKPVSPLDVTGSSGSFQLANGTLGEHIDATGFGTIYVSTGPCCS